MTDEKFVVDLYIRVSTDRQVREGDSLEEQENELKKFCEFRNFHIVMPPVKSRKNKRENQAKVRSSNREK